MSLANWNQRFFMSTRGKIVTLLRRAARTVEELAQALDLTDNAVRAHLATLERDGIVQQRGTRRGSGKPSYVYELSLQGEQLFPRAYGPVLAELLSALSEQMSVQEVETLLRATGRRIATQWQAPPGDLRARLAMAVDVLNELGGMAELEISNETFCIRGYSCPLAAVVRGHPQVCLLAEALLTDVAGIPMRECCDQGEPPRCCFRPIT